MLSKKSPRRPAGTQQSNHRSRLIGSNIGFRRSFWINVAQSNPENRFSATSTHSGHRTSETRGGPGVNAIKTPAMTSRMEGESESLCDDRGLSCFQLGQEASHRVDTVRYASSLLRWNSSYGDLSQSVQDVHLSLHLPGNQQIEPEIGTAE